MNDAEKKESIKSTRSLLKKRCVCLGLGFCCPIHRDFRVHLASSQCIPFHSLERHGRQCLPAVILTNANSVSSVVLNLKHTGGCLHFFEPRRSAEVSPVEVPVFPRNQIENPWFVCGKGKLEPELPLVSHHCTWTVFKALVLASTCSV